MPFVYAFDFFIETRQIARKDFPPPTYYCFNLLCPRCWCISRNNAVNINIISIFVIYLVLVLISYLSLHFTRVSNFFAARNLKYGNLEMLLLIVRRCKHYIYWIMLNYVHIIFTLDDILSCILQCMKYYYYTVVYQIISRSIVTFYVYNF